MSALRFFFKKMLKRRDIHFDDLPFPKTPRKLPTVLSPEEVRRMIDQTTNLMHRTILMVLYATGVRRTELSLLKVTDIDSKRMVVHVHDDGTGLRKAIQTPVFQMKGASADGRYLVVFPTPSETAATLAFPLNDGAAHSHRKPGSCVSEMVSGREILAGNAWTACGCHAVLHYSFGAWTSAA